MYSESFKLTFQVHQFSISFSSSAPCSAFATPSLSAQQVLMRRERGSASKIENKMLQNLKKFKSKKKWKL